MILLDVECREELVCFEKGFSRFVCAHIFFFRARNSAHAHIAQSSIVFSLQNTKNATHVMHRNVEKKEGILPCVELSLQMQNGFGNVYYLFVCCLLAGWPFVIFFFIYKKNVRDISSGCRPSNSDNG